jgi:nitrile hydratase
MFHAAWEPRVLAMTLAMGATGQWTIDASRAARETLSDYRDLSYYAIWLLALEKLLIERDLETPAELATGRVSAAPRKLDRVLRADDVAATLARGAPTLRASHGTPRFAVGQQVRTRAGRVDHHTRLPGYAQGKAGQIERVLGTHVFADANARGSGEDPEWLYTVVFDGTELWGPDESAAGLRVSIDAWQSYLEPV